MAVTLQLSGCRTAGMPSGSDRRVVDDAVEVRWRSPRDLELVWADSIAVRSARAVRGRVLWQRGDTLTLETTSFRSGAGTRHFGQPFPIVRVSVASSQVLLLTSHASIVDKTMGVIVLATLAIGVLSFLFLVSVCSTSRCFD